MIQDSLRHQELLPLKLQLLLPELRRVHPLHRSSQLRIGDSFTRFSRQRNLHPGPVTPALPQGSSEDKLDKVLTSLDALTTFIKSEVVTRNHLDKFHQEQMQVLEKRIEQSVGPVHVELKELRARLVTLETQHIG